MLLDKNWMDLWQKQNQLAKVLETNRVTERFGLVLSGQEAEMIVEERANALRTQRAPGQKCSGRFLPDNPDPRNRSLQTVPS